MPFIPIPGGYSVVVQYHVGSIIFQNVFGYADNAALTQTKTDLIGGVLATAYGHLLGAQKTTVAYDSCTVTDESVVTGAQFLAGTFNPGPGTDTGELLPYQTAALVSWATGTRGRSFRGRTYLAGFCEDFSSGRDVSGTLITAITAFKNAILADGGFAVLSRYSGVDPTTHQPIPRSSGLATPFTSATVHPLWRTQRRRATR